MNISNNNQLHGAFAVLYADDKRSLLNKGKAMTGPLTEIWAPKTNIYLVRRAPIFSLSPQDRDVGVQKHITT